MSDLSMQQMKDVGAELIAAGFPVDLEEADKDGPCDWDEATGTCIGETYVWITWGNWTIYDDGSMAMEGLEINNCDHLAFIKTAHEAWHRVGGEMKTSAA